MNCSLARIAELEAAQVTPSQPETAEPALELSNSQREFLLYLCDNSPASYSSTKDYSKTCLPDILELRKAGLTKPESSSATGIIFSITPAGRRALGK